jgi:predicted ester cyclase
MTAFEVSFKEVRSCLSRTKPWRVGLPDMRATLHQLVADGDFVVARFTLQGTHKGTLLGTAPTGKRVTFRGMDMVRLKDGRAAEVWHEGMMSK